MSEPPPLPPSFEPAPETPLPFAARAARAREIAEQLRPNGEFVDCPPSEVSLYVELDAHIQALGAEVFARAAGLGAPDPDELSAQFESASNEMFTALSEAENALRDADPKDARLMADLRFRSDMLRLRARRFVDENVQAALEVRNVAIRSALEDLGVALGEGDTAWFVRGKKFVQGAGRVPGARAPRQVEQLASEALGFYPQVWVESTEHKPIMVQEITGRAFYNGYGAHTDAAGVTRPVGKVAVSLSSPNPLGAMTHELGHSFEESVTGVIAMEQAFLLRRTGALANDGQPREGKVALTPGSDTETGYRDSLPDAYMGRTYLNGDREVLTTGMEALFHANYGAGVGGNGYSRDDDFLRAIVGMLASAAR